jgi:phosphoenolpyruvate synthase/pyruvate phosphate dikinase
LQKIAKRSGFHVAEGFALSALIFWQFIVDNRLELQIKRALSNLDTSNYSNLELVSMEIKSLILSGKFSEEIKENISKIIKRCVLNAKKSL